MDRSPTDRWLEYLASTDSSRAAKYREMDVPLFSLSPVFSPSFLYTQHKSLVEYSLFTKFQHLFSAFHKQRVSEEFCFWWAPHFVPGTVPFATSLWYKAHHKNWNATRKWEQKFQDAAGCPQWLYHSSASWTWRQDERPTEQRCPRTQSPMVSRRAAAAPTVRFHAVLELKAASPFWQTQHLSTALAIHNTSGHSECLLPKVFLPYVPSLGLSPACIWLRAWEYSAAAAFSSSLLLCKGTNPSSQDEVSCHGHITACLSSRILSMCLFPISQIKAR